MMEIFGNAQVGDLVYCRLYGEGSIKGITQGSIYPVTCLMENGDNYFYTIDGCFNSNHKEPVLFYRKGEERYLSERPEPDIDWNTVEPGTLCIVKDHEEEPEREREFLCFVDGKRWFRKINNIHANPWNYARIK